MQTNTLISIKTNLDIVSITKFNIVQNIDEHTYLYFEGILNQKARDKYALENNALKTVEIVRNNVEEEIIFKGIPLNIEVKVLKGVYHLIIKAVSFTYLLDIKKEYKSFQNENMTYKEMNKKAISTTEKAQIIDTATENKKIETFLMQYHETNWEYMKRMSSHFNTCIVSDMTTLYPALFFGIPKGNDIGKLPKVNVNISRNNLRYLSEKVNGNHNIKNGDSIEIELTDQNRNFSIGDKCTWQDYILYIKYKEITYEKGILSFKYRLATKGSFSKPKYYNMNIIGLSLRGTVLKSIQDRIKVHLEIDDVQDEGTAWEFQYTTPYTAEGQTGWYCPPEIGDTVLINFQTEDESKAVGFNSLRMSITSDKVSNTDIKFFRTDTGQELMFSPEQVKITVVDGVIKETGEYKVTIIVLDKNTGLTFKTTESINFQTNKSLTMEAEGKMSFIAGDEIKLNCKTSEILIKDKIELKSDDVKIN